jgi:uncharacterized protein YjbI with pentapeptide repeats
MYLAPAVIAALLALSAACFAADPMSLERLQVSGSCPGCDLTGAVLGKISAPESILDGANFSAADVSDSHLGDCRPCAFVGAKITNSDFIDCGRSDFSKATTNGLKLRYCKWCSFNGADLTAASFDRAELNGASFDRSRMRNASFKNAEFGSASFAGADGSAASFAGATFSGPDFAGAVLKRSDFSFTTIKDASFQGVDLEGAKFRGAKLVNVVLAGANLKNADFTGAALTYEGRSTTTLRCNVLIEAGAIIGENTKCEREQRSNTSAYTSDKRPHP